MLNIQENILLAPYTTFKIGGPAKYFCEAHDAEEIREFCHWAKEKNVPIFVLGGGSHLLVNDSGFDGLVIKTSDNNYKIDGEKIIAESGTSLAKLVTEAANLGLAGLEWAVGIPGTIGGAIFGNAGAYGHSISEVISKVITYSLASDSLKEYKHKDCDFVYRGSGFKRFNEVIIETEISLRREERKKVQQKLRDVIKDRIAVRIPPYPSPGCIFKNHVLKKDDAKDIFLLQNFPSVKERIRSNKAPVGHMIEQAGLKGKQIGGAKIWEGHANYIVNFKNAKASDVIALINLCKKTVREKFGIELEEEIRLIGFN